MTVHHHVQRWARCAPDSVAVVSGDNTLTYGDLDQRAHRLALQLLAHGIGRESTIAVCMERSVNLIVALLAVLKAGAAYLPLDPSHPAARLGQLLGDSRPAATVTDRPHASVITGLSTGPVLLVDGEHELVGAPSGLPPVYPENLAYVIYTSGSTGQPKGVSITHRGITGLVVDPNYCRIGPDDRVTQVANVSFDASVFEIWLALANGATLVIVPPDVMLDPAALVRMIAQYRITALVLPSAVLNQQSYFEPLSQCRLRYLFFGGDVVNPHAVHSLAAAGFAGQLVHCYGPTETAVLASFETVTEPTGGLRRLPIGRSISDAELYVVDGRFRRVPMDIPGELIVGGGRIARGYLNSPRLTAEKFIPNPFGQRPGERAYRTGDLAVLLPDGRLDFLGRLDRQVKIRGFRVEPGEVEAALLALPEVAAATVLVREGPGGGKSLAGYVVLTAGEQAETRQLRLALQGRLPPHLVPPSLAIVDEFPLTASGKIDAAALLALGGQDRPPADETGLTTSTERTIAALWRDLLGLERVCADDDFFELGGHSLLAVEMISRLAAITGVSVPVAVLLEAPTVSALAARLRAPSSGAPPNEGIGLRVLRERADAPMLALVHPIGGGIACYRDLLDELRNHSVVGFEAESESSGTFSAIAARYLGELDVVRPDGPMVFAGWSVGGVLAHEMARLCLDRYQLRVPVVMIDSVDPRALTYEPTEHDCVVSFVHDLWRGTGTAAPDPDQDSLRGNLHEVLASVADRLAAAGAVKQIPVRELLRRYYIYRRLYHAFFTHQPEPYDGPVHLIRPSPYFQPQYGSWRALCGSLTVTEVTGNHYSLIRKPAVRFVAAIIDDLLSGPEARR